MRRNFEVYIANFVVLLTLVCYFDFFKFTIIPSAFSKLMQLVVAMLLIVLIVVKIIYKPDKKIRMNFSLPILLLILGSLPSYFTANAFHNQSFIISFFGNRLIWFYLLYFYLHLYQISIKYVLRLIILTGLFAVFLYFLQFTLYPRVIFDIWMRESRGTIRLFIAGMICSQATYFYFLNQFLSKQNPIYLLLAVLTFSIFLLQGTRQLIFGMAFLTSINLLFSTRVNSKFFISFLVSLAFIAIFYAFREIIYELTSLSTNQVNQFGEGIRIKAVKFFLSSFMANDLAYIFGNGDPGPGSMYSQMLTMYAIKYGYFLSDIGIIGDYVKYGIVFIIGGLLMLGKGILFNVSPEYRFLKYYILTQCFTLVTGFGIFGGVDVVLIMILYVFDVDRSQIEREHKLAQIESTETFI